MLNFSVQAKDSASSCDHLEGELRIPGEMKKEKIISITFQYRGTSIDSLSGPQFLDADKWSVTTMNTLPDMVAFPERRSLTYFKVVMHRLKFHPLSHQTLILLVRRTFSLLLQRIHFLLIWE